MFEANRWLGGLAAGLILWSCAERGAGPAAEPPPRDDVGTPLNKAWWMATHNSYWVNRGFDDPFGSSVDVHLHDQLVAYDVRTVEIDIHRAAADHEFDVYHTLPGNSTCPTLRACLRELRGFHDAVTQHEVFHLVLEFKEIKTAFFTDTHTIEDLDAVLREELGELLYEPRDLLRRCPGAKTLVDCVRAKGWPSVEYLRGRFVVLMLGNWDELGASNTAAWAQYATSGPIAGRAAFPMASSWVLSYATLNPKVTALVSEKQFAAAISQSAYLQTEDLADPRIKPFLRDNGIIRTGAADTLEAQEAKRDLGIQMLQTDYPWVVPGGREAGQPFHPFAATAAALVEPGMRVEIAAPATDTAEAVLYERPAPVFEAVLSSGRSTRPTCLVAVADGTALDGVGICRGKWNAPGKQNQQASRVWALTCTASICTRTELAHGEKATGGLAIDVIGIVSADGTRYCITAFNQPGTGEGSSWVNDDSLCKDKPFAYVGVLTLAPDGVTEPSAAVGVAVRSETTAESRAPGKSFARSFTGVTVTNQ